jgi:hypothetical protein
MYGDKDRCTHIARRPRIARREIVSAYALTPAARVVAGSWRHPLRGLNCLW